MTSLSRSGGRGNKQGGQGQPDHTAADYYFDSYAHFGIHEEMLKDTVRTRTYQQAIQQNSQLIRGKIVLDVGCGTGILSMFAAQAGAAHVYGIEMSAIADQAQEIIADNGFSNAITIIKGKVEEISLPVEKVDVIISEWMGYFLLYESMLDTVLFARDRWLAPGGALLPDKASLYLCAIEDAEYKHEKIDYWDNVYGLNFSSIRRLAMAEPLVDVVEPDQVATDACEVLTLDLNTMAKTDATFQVPFRLTARRNDYLHAIVAYFTVWFSACHKPLSIPTSPSVRRTHWKQTVLYLEDEITVCQDEQVTGQLSCTPNKSNPRDLDIAVDYECNGARGNWQRHQTFRMR
ncbi:hypothetical protein WJX73_008363 [Symbiochloris irregularis]|uniref:Methyltransferase domain-containing protein n=1 Tax=Symbiochloris irregularis TaxID=706552 RepID=A0AAW1NSE2_9CHLO